MAMTAKAPMHVGTCAECARERCGVYYVIDSESDRPTWVCQECERRLAKSRQRPPRQTVTT